MLVQLRLFLVVLPQQYPVTLRAHVRLAHQGLLAPTEPALLDHRRVKQGWGLRRRRFGGRQRLALAVTLAFRLCIVRGEFELLLVHRRNIIHPERIAGQDKCVAAGTYPHKQTPCHRLWAGVPLKISQEAR